MANLETLELTINGNAESASQGLKNLISSLSALSKAVGKNVSGLRLLNKEIANMKGIKGLNIGSASGNVRAVQAQTKALKENAKATQTWAEAQAAAGYPLTSNNVKRGNSGIKRYKSVMPVAEATKTVAAQQKSDLYNWSKTSTKMWNFQPKEAGAFVSKYGKGEKWGSAYYNPQSEATNGRASEHFATVSKEIKKVGEAADEAKPKVSGFSKLLGRVGRIFSTMMIRTAIRSLIKAFSEAWQNAYQFSKSMGGEFAESVDKAKSLLAGTATNIISAFSPALTALIPIIQTVAASIQYLCNIIKSLFSLIGGGTDLFGASADSINKFAGSASGGGKAAKEMLANFDELNVISQESGGGGGGGGGYTSGLLSGIVSDEMAKVQLIVSESLLALGLIMACTGHIGLGVGLMAIGAAGIAKTVLEDWGKLPKEVQGELATIMSIVGVASLALGAILAFSGANIPLGIGLMAIGAVNLAAVAYVNWKNGLPDNVRSTITTITGIVGGGLLALGAILTFSGAKPALGIGMMIAGAASLATAVALNWSSLQTKLQTPIKYITTLISGALLVVGSILAFSGAKIPLGIALMAAGAAGLATTIALNWSSIQTKMQGPIGTITAVLSSALLAVGGILAFSGASVPLGIALIAAGAVGLATTVIANWRTLSLLLTGSVAVVTGIVSTALLAVGAVLAFSGASIPLGIGLMAAGAVGLAATVAVNWTTIQTKLQNPIARITAIVSGALLALGAILAFSGANIPLGIAMMAAGGIGLVSAIAVNWDSVVQGIVGAFDSLKKALQPVADLLNSIWNTIQKIFGAGDKVAVDTTKTVNYSVVTGSSSGGFGANGITKSTVTRMAKASGAFDIPQGDLFIANEAGAELIGSINGKTSVANQSQIIEGISSGVERANAEQNTLLRQQNELLREILEKDTSVRFGASVAFGRVARQSLDMYNGMVGG